ILVAPKEEVADTLVKGICGQEHGWVIPGMIGMEAGQSAFGDAYAWSRQELMRWVNNLLAASGVLPEADLKKVLDFVDDQIIPQLGRQAEALPVTETSELALDWFNGRRTPDADQTLKAAIQGLNLGTDAPRIFRAIVEATC